MKLARQTKPLATLLVLALASICAAACAKSDAGVRAKPATTRPVPTIDDDGDFDNLSHAHYDSDDHFGSVAGTADARAIAMLAKRYYRLAAADDGAAVCAMIYWPVSEAMSEGNGSEGSSRHGDTCAAIVTRLLRPERSQLALKAHELKVVEVLVQGERAWIVMTFAGTRERHLVLHREGNGWALLTFQDRGLP